MIKFYSDGLNICKYGFGSVWKMYKFEHKIM